MSMTLSWRTKAGPPGPRLPRRTTSRSTAACSNGRRPVTMVATAPDHGKPEAPRPGPHRILQDLSVKSPSPHASWPAAKRWRR